MLSIGAKGEAVKKQRVKKVKGLDKKKTIIKNMYLNFHVFVFLSKISNDPISRVYNRKGA